MGHTEVVPESSALSQRTSCANYEEYARITRHIKLMNYALVILAATCIFIICGCSWYIIRTEKVISVLREDIDQQYMCNKTDVSDLMLHSNHPNASNNAKNSSLRDFDQTRVNANDGYPPHDCLEILVDNLSADSGVYDISTPFTSDMKSTISVFCDMTTHGGGWIVFQRRIDGSEDFNRNWLDYKNGFGNLEGEFWLGLDTIHYLVTNGQWELLVNMTDESVGTTYALYENFYVGSESSGYVLIVANYTGDANNGLDGHSDMKFSTKDVDNDKAADNCAVFHGGGWWYNRCLNSALNKPYGQIAWGGFSASIEYVEMKMRMIT